MYGAALAAQTFEVVVIMIVVEVAVLLGATLFIVGVLVGASVARTVADDRRRRGSRR